MQKVSQTGDDSIFAHRWATTARWVPYGMWIYSIYLRQWTNGGYTLVVLYCILCDGNMTVIEFDKLEPKIRT